MKETVFFPNPHLAMAVLKFLRRLEENESEGRSPKNTMLACWITTVGSWIYAVLVLTILILDVSGKVLTYLYRILLAKEAREVPSEHNAEGDSLSPHDITCTLIDV